MKLPNCESAYVPQSKLINYVLSETHPVGRAKAEFLRALGFDKARAELLEQQLLAIARSEEIQNVISSPHGIKYVIDGLLASPRGRSVRVRTVWIIDEGQEYPRFVTLYPAPAGTRS